MLFFIQNEVPYNNTHTVLNFPHTDAFPNMWPLIVKIQKKLLLNLLFLYLLSFYTHSSCSKLWHAFIEVYLRKQEFPNLSHLLHSHHLQLFKTIKPWVTFLEKNKNCTLSKRFVTVIDYRAEKNKIILKEKTYR